MVKEVTIGGLATSGDETNGQFEDNGHVFVPHRTSQWINL